MKIAIISVTKNGTALSRRLSEGLDSRHECTRYTFHRYADADAVSFDSLGALTADIFYKTDALVFLCACGTAVRVIAPHIRSKFTDPAVVAADQQGKFAVSLLSGHVGRANALTRLVADILGAVPVITTATDSGGKFSPDTFAAANHLHICEPEIAKEIAAAVLNGDPIGIASDFEMKNVPDIFSDGARLGISISNNADSSPFERTLHLLPKNLVLGAGCKKGTDADTFRETILGLLAEHDIPTARVCALNTIDVKSGEAAILRFADEYALPLNFFTADELMRVNGSFDSSDFVMNTVGADNVCERSACADGGTLLIRKTNLGGITAAVSQLPVTIDFERDVL